MRHISGMSAVLLLALGCAGTDTPPSPPRDAGHDARDAGTTRDAGPDASMAPDASTPDAGNTPDAGDPLDAGETLDAGDEPDAGETPDAGPSDFEVTTTKPYWRTVFFDDFRGRTGAPDDAYCFDDIPVQCTIWSGGSHRCDLSDTTGTGIIPPTTTNLGAVLKLAEPGRDVSSMSESDLKAAYATLIRERWRHINKCTWTSYQMVNWMATDYQGNWAARFDPTLVTVDPRGKGYLELSAASAPAARDCIFGGSRSGPNCQVQGFAAGVLRAGVSYRVDTTAERAGVYTAQVGGACPNGGTVSGSECLVHLFTPYVLERSGVAYWVDADPRWPGVYYANRTFACRDNIDYAPGLNFRNLTCPVLNGGMMSMHAPTLPWVDPVSGEARLRGRTQFRGRFETKVRIPKGIGSFPAVWLMPTKGAWPYKGGEIDIIEARDNADETYQTYHHGKCYQPGNLALIDADGGGECATKGGASVNLSRGQTVRQRSVDEFWTRDHIFAVEWSETGIEYFINGVKTHVVAPGSPATTHPASAPQALAQLGPQNFPTDPFYWILNHSTYVPPAAQAGFQKQTFLIDYVRSSERCTKNSEFCPCGGRFVEGTGCIADGSTVLRCPPGLTLPPIENGDTYAPFCAVATGDCIHGGTREGQRCVLRPFNAGELTIGVTYWVDADPRWPGVYYAKVGNACPYGGSGTVNCQVKALPADLVETGVDYLVDPRNGGSLSYVPDFAP